MPMRLRARAVEPAPAAAASEHEGSLSPEPREPRRPRARKPKQFRTTQEAVDMKCEWASCTYSTQKTQEYTAHVMTHISACGEEESGASEYQPCRWGGCDQGTESAGERRRHLLYHAHHSRLMTLGAAVQQRQGAEPCRLDPAERHLVPDVAEPFACLWDDCTAKWDDPQGFFYHVAHHVLCHYGDLIQKRGPNDAKCLWKDCTVAVPNHYKLKEHMRVHTLERVVACPNCGNAFANNQRFVDHCKRQVSAQKLRFQCSHCLKLFPTERLLRDHIRHHINNTRCPVCGLTLSSRRSLKQHYLYRHSEARAHRCSICQATFKTEQTKTRHEAAHTVQDRVIKCPSCDYTSLNHRRVQRHVKVAHEGEKQPWYLCHLCVAKYRGVQNITRHLKRVHHLTVPEGHSRFSYRRHEDGHFRLETLRYESLDVAEQAPAAAPDVLALTCQEGDAPDTITTDDGRELRLPDHVRAELGTGRRVLVCVQGDQVQLLARMEAMEELADPEDPDALMVVVDDDAVVSVQPPPAP